MSDLRQRLVENMKTIKQMMLDVENASHYVDFLDKAIADKLAAGLTMEPKKMLWDVNNTTTLEWKQQTKKYTLGYMHGSGKTKKNVK